MMNKTALLLILFFSVGLVSSAKAQGPALPGCGNISILANSIIDGTQFDKGVYQLNTFGMSCDQVLGLNGILGVILSMGKDDKLPAPWSSLSEAIGAPKFSSSASVGFRLQRLQALSPVSPIQEQQFTGVTSDANVSSSAIIKIGASADFGLTSKKHFLSTDTVKINAAINPQGNDAGQPANIYVVAELMGAVPVYMSLGRLGEWNLWNGVVTDLVPAHTVSALENELRFQIYSGKLDAGFKVALHIGYSTISSANQKLIHYNSTPYVITIE